jgi:hypothetical protein
MFTGLKLRVQRFRVNRFEFTVEDYFSLAEFFLNMSRMRLNGISEH